MFDDRFVDQIVVLGRFAGLRIEISSSICAWTFNARQIFLA
jgi:hypothetical protein